MSKNNHRGMLNGTRKIVIKHHKNLAKEKGGVYKKIFADNLWGLARNHFYLLGDYKAAFVFALKSLIADFSFAKILSPVMFHTKKIFKKQRKRLDKFYNVTQTASILGVHRQSIYYWIKKGWLKPKRDHRNYPVFTVLDIENIIECRNSAK